MSREELHMRYEADVGTPLTVAVIGAGSWGTALALHAARAGHDVRLWGHDPRKIEAIREQRENRVYLPGFRLPQSIEVTGDGGAALRAADIVISAVPSRHLRDVWKSIGRLPRKADLVSATKGIEEGSGLRMTQVLRDVLPDAPRSVSSLSGPSFARELAQGHPTAVTLGCEDLEIAAAVQRSLSAGPLRIYRNTDLVGVELGGALKNVIAVAAGIVDGLGLGTNSGAALVCRGLKEMSVLAAALGARPETLTGLAGLGDLVLTCTGPLSRNRHVGVEVGRGRTLAETMAEMQMVAEGVVTVISTREVAGELGIEMPITEQTYQVLYRERSPREAMAELLSRALAEE